MTLEEFVKKLKTFPPEHQLRFYCPTDKTYYYINISCMLSDGTIYLNSVLNRTPENNTYGHWIYLYTASIFIDKKREIKLNVNGQEFKFL
jgi:hypothetical protein